MARPTALVVMGVSGSGKSTIGRRLALATDRVFAEADDFHTPAAIATMAVGTPLTDADRWPWLAAIASWITAEADAGRNTVVTCSALKRSYRDFLRSAGADVGFVWLQLPSDVIAERLAGRTGHFMPASLLASQLETLEPLDADELALGDFAVDAGGSIDAVVARVIARWSAEGGGLTP